MADLKKAWLKLQAKNLVFGFTIKQFGASKIAQKQLLT